MENSMVVPKKIKNRTTLYVIQQFPPPGIYPKEFKGGTQTHICTPRFTAATFTLAKRWKGPKYPSTDELTNSMW